jgi:hypothetical protein
MFAWPATIARGELRIDASRTAIEAVDGAGLVRRMSQSWGKR